MNFKIIVDSCCDVSKQIRKQIDIISVPLKMRLGDKEFIDDDSLNISEFMTSMKEYKGSVGSSCPSPLDYQQKFEQHHPCFVVTISSKLSGSFASAVLGKKIAEENGFSNIHVLDSKSASAGETLIALKLKSLMKSGMELKTIITTITSFIENMKTYFVLENYDNLQKNGRLSKIAGKIINVLNIKLVMGADGNGNIALFGKPRGEKNMLEKLISLIENSGKETKNQNLVISHCNNPELAQKLKTIIKEKFKFSEIFIVPTGGISSLYADNKGIIMSF